MASTTIPIIIEKKPTLLPQPIVLVYFTPKQFLGSLSLLNY